MHIRNQYKPDYVSSPGETLKEVLDMLCMSSSDLADSTGIPEEIIGRIMNGKSAITADTAIKFEKTLGIPAGFWITREQNYRKSLK